MQIYNPTTIIIWNLAHGLVLDMWVDGHGTYYFSTDSMLIKFGHDLSVSHCRYICSCLLVQNISYRIFKYGYVLFPYQILHT
jgi:hypothetical protein